MSTASQHQRILNWLKRGKRLSRTQAMNDLGIANVTARISELRQDGHLIMDSWRTTKNRYGEPVKHKVYWLSVPEAPGF